IPEFLFPDDVPVPNVTGLSVEEAERILAESRLRMAVELEVFDNEVPAGHIISQDPKANSMKKENQVVFVRVSKGPEHVYMPSVIGLSHREAQLALTQAGFTLGEAKFVQTGDHPVNTVIDQEPKPDEYVALGSPVVLVVSQGLDTIPIVVLPNFRGKELETVRREIAELGLREGKLIPEFSTTIPKNHVVEQNPPPFAEVEIGWEVDLVYSEGSPASGKSDAEGIQRWTTNGDWHVKQVRIDVPEGRDQEIAIIVVDDFGAREVYRQVHAGGTSFDFTAQGRGEQARIQVYIGGRLFIDRDFVE
ncbi:MAG: PASTA domain-containing protein, partial [Limnochordia bacterium]